MRGKNNFTSVFILLNVHFLKAAGQNVRNGQGHSLCDFCFVFIFFYLPMLSALLLFPLIRPFLCKGFYMRVCWRRPVRLKSGGKKGQLTKQHFISLKFFVRSRGVSGVNPPWCRRAVSGVEVCRKISSWGKENFSWGWWHALAQCPYLRRVFLILPIKVPPTYNVPSVLPKIPPWQIITLF